MAVPVARTAQVVTVVKQLAQQHPDKVRVVLDTVERGVNQRTHNKYARSIKQGRRALEKQLGVNTVTVKSTAWSKVRGRTS